MAIKSIERMMSDRVRYIPPTKKYSKWNELPSGTLMYRRTGTGRVYLYVYDTATHGYEITAMTYKALEQQSLSPSLIIVPEEENLTPWDTHGSAVQRAWRARSSTLSFITELREYLAEREGIEPDVLTQLSVLHNYLSNNSELGEAWFALGISIHPSGVNTFSTYQALGVFPDSWVVPSHPLRNPLTDRYEITWNRLVGGLGLPALVDFHEKVWTYKRKSILNRYVWDIHAGAEMRSVYDEEHFGSCMQRRASLQFLMDNPQRVACISIRNPVTKRLQGRALLWLTDEGEFVLDRIYPVADKDIHTRAFIEFAQRMGWNYRLSQSSRGGFTDGPVKLKRDATYHVTLNNSNLRGYPFLDTFNTVTDFALDDIHAFLNEFRIRLTNRSDSTVVTAVTLRATENNRLTLESRAALTPEEVRKRVPVKNMVASATLGRLHWQGGHYNTVFIELDTSFANTAHTGTATKYMREFTPTFARPFADGPRLQNLPEVLKGVKPESLATGELGQAAKTKEQEQYEREQEMLRRRKEISFDVQQWEEEEDA